MSTLAMNNKSAERTEQEKSANQNRFRRALAYAAIALLCVAVDHIYALFGHGVRSASMSFMFLYPLGAAALYALIGLLFPKAAARLGRVGVNLLGSGIATLTTGAFLAGILEIAGSSSAYIPVFFAVGWGMTALGVVGLLVGAFRG